MALDNGTTTLKNNPPAARLPPRRRVVFLRRRKLPTVRLGGNQGGPKRGLLLTRILRKMRLRWMKLRLMKRLKEYYRGLIKDIIEAGATVESYQQRLFMESSIAVPVMGLGFNSFPGVAGSDRPRSIYFM